MLGVQQSIRRDSKRCRLPARHIVFIALPALRAGCARQKAGAVHGFCEISSIEAIDEASVDDLAVLEDAPPSTTAGHVEEYENPIAIRLATAGMFEHPLQLSMLGNQVHRKVVDLPHAVHEAALQLRTRGQGETLLEKFGCSCAQWPVWKCHHLHARSQAVLTSLPSDEMFTFDLLQALEAQGVQWLFSNLTVWQSSWRTQLALTMPAFGDASSSLQFARAGISRSSSSGIGGRRWDTLLLSSSDGTSV